MIGHPIAQPYYQFNREERHLAAILFHLLCLPQNAEQLLRHLKLPEALDQNSWGIYYEYSYLRDFWDKLEADVGANQRKQGVIREWLTQFGATEERLGRTIQPGNGPPTAWNALFKAHPSQKYIESPANWQLGVMATSELAKEPEVLRAACLVKWAFRIKPDLVVQSSRTQALCIELKSESKESLYPAKGLERAALKRAGLPPAGNGLPAIPVRQSEMQRLMMEAIFGKANVYFLFVTKSDASRTKGKSSSQNGCAMTWQTIFGLLTIPDSMPAFARHAVEMLRAGQLTPRGGGEPDGAT